MIFLPLMLLVVLRWWCLMMALFFQFYSFLFQLAWRSGHWRLSLSQRLHNVTRLPLCIRHSVLQLGGQRAQHRANFQVTHGREELDGRLLVGNSGAILIVGHVEHVKGKFLQVLAVRSVVRAYGILLLVTLFQQPRDEPNCVFVARVTNLHAALQRVLVAVVGYQGINPLHLEGPLEVLRYRLETWRPWRHSCCCCCVNRDESAPFFLFFVQLPLPQDAYSESMLCSAVRCCSRAECKTKVLSI